MIAYKWHGGSKWQDGDYVLEVRQVKGTKRYVVMGRIAKNYEGTDLLIDTLNQEGTLLENYRPEGELWYLR